jgi:hypothetical protein
VADDEIIHESDDYLTSYLLHLFVYLPPPPFCSF